MAGWFYGHLSVLECQNFFRYVNSSQNATLHYVTHPIVNNGFTLLNLKSPKILFSQNFVKKITDNDFVVEILFVEI